MKNFIAEITLLSRLILPAPTAGLAYVSPIALSEINKTEIQEKVLAKETLDLTKRHLVKEVNESFGDNILLILHYLKGDNKSFIDESGKVDWKEVRQSFTIGFTLNPGETFAFHDKVLPEFEGKVAKTIPVKYESREGFKAVDGLLGNGVCHLATLMNWVASEAGIKTVSLVNHDFFPIPQTPQKYGVAIYYTGDGEAKRQNLYITNNLTYPLSFKFLVSKEKAELTITKKE